MRKKQARQTKGRSTKKVRSSKANSVRKKHALPTKRGSAAKKTSTTKSATSGKRNAAKATKTDLHVEALQYLVESEENETKLMIASTLGLTDEH